MSVNTSERADGEAAAAGHGYSLVETAVALTLLLGVLAPMSGLVVSLALEKRNRHEVEALALGRWAMEDALHRQLLVSEPFPLPDDAWQVEREVVPGGMRVTYVVRVYRRGRVAPLVELMTVRLR